MNNTLSLKDIANEPTWTLEDVDNPALYHNREMTWLSFNERVLSNAFDVDIPLFERVKFLAIVGSNLDEFYMKRIGGLYQQVFAGIRQPSVDGLQPMEQIVLAQQYVSRIEAQQRESLDLIKQDLLQENIQILSYQQLNNDQKTALGEYFYNEIYPLITPQAIDPAHPFPFVSNLSINLLISVKLSEASHHSITRIKIPTSHDVPRFIKVKDTDNKDKFTFVTLEDLIRNNLDSLLPGMEITDCTIFRVTRNAITEHSEEQAEDLLELIEAELRERKFAPIVRLQIEENASDEHRDMLVKFLGVDAGNDVTLTHSLLGTRDLMELVSLPKPHLRNENHKPIDHPQLVNHDNIFQAIREHNTVLLHHPYQSFATSVERFLKESSEDERVLAIKMTLYRTSSDSKIIHHLITAAQNGKQVAVVMEIKATFDESANIRWAQRLERAGIHVTYGIVGLKTHCKVIHVIRRESQGLVRYAHLGTGNYHAGTARLYTDLGILTYDQEIGTDLTELFNYLTTGYTPKRHYLQIVPAPKLLKSTLLKLIEKARLSCEAGGSAKITIKVNALEDKDIVKGMYLASHAGVKIKLFVRDTCRIRPGIAGLSENISVRSITGRFLEHSRIFWFDIDGESEIYISSADLMKRNLESRVEVMVPILAPALQEDIRAIFKLLFKDNVGAWKMLADGSYCKVEPQALPETEKTAVVDNENDTEQKSNTQKRISAQEKTIRYHSKAYKASQKLKVRKTQSLTTS
jgi:polyphosphate kinase